MHPATTELLSLVYASRAVVGFGLDDLDALLTHSRRANADAGITGLLLFKDHRFLQLLEGPAAAVREKMAFIAEDPRHEQVTVLLEEDVPTRQFPDWTMGYAAEDTLQRAEVPGHRTTFDDIDFIPDDHRVGPTLPELRELLRWFREEQASAGADLGSARPR
ncbi:BLUF domain-containing protein [Curtobacterium caseinilyticum]|uniref:BLUF domain-containing protein n=1 Tax=Curtobacterium caseinilyticum TaxID=3055137 RepID=A0ABT7TPK6_9MICO|nr:BLUF domain-containing protein [Curtobacterium caseinilyticum]MDM7891289.1 BLUF domain-containing protein [Curtobacterium caseinilyticum]